MQRRIPSFLSCRTSLALLGGLAAAVPAKAVVRAEPDLERILGVLESIHEGGDAAWKSGMDKLERMGVSATPMVFDLLVGRTQLEEEEGQDGEEVLPLLDRRGQDFLRELLTQWPARDVIPYLSGALSADSPIEDYWVAIRLLGETGDAAALDEVLEILTRVDPIHLGRPYVRATVEHALTQLLSEDKGAHGRLVRIDPEAHAGVMPSLVVAVGRAGRGSGLMYLIDLLEENSELEDVILKELSRPDPRDYEMIAEDCARAARGYLEGTDSKLRRRAAGTLGRLRDAESLPAILEMLDPEDAGSARVASLALRDMSGLNFGLDRRQWSAWYEAEQEWNRSRSATVLRDISSDDLATVLAALREISEHPLFHRRLGREVASLVRHEEGTIAQAACVALQRLNAPVALDPLVDALADPRETVREAAHSTLLKLTGMKMPPAVAEWSSWLLR